MINRNSAQILDLDFPSYIPLIKKLSAMSNNGHRPLNIESELSTSRIDFHALYLKESGGIIIPIFTDGGTKVYGM